MSEAENVQTVYESLKRDFPHLKEGQIGRKLLDAVGSRLYWIWLNWWTSQEDEKEA